MLIIGISLLMSSRMISVWCGSRMGGSMRLFTGFSSCEKVSKMRLEMISGVIRTHSANSFPRVPIDPYNFL
jgi:hypothetical protein